MGALINIFLIWGLTLWLLYEAISRIININEVEIDAGVMLVTSCFGLGCNLVMVKVLHSPISEEFEGAGCQHHHHHHHHHGHDHHHHHHHEDGHCNHDHSNNGSAVLRDDTDESEEDEENRSKK